MTQIHAVHKKKEKKKTHFKVKDKGMLKGEGEELYHENTDNKEAGVATLNFAKVDLRTKKYSRDKVGCYTMIK